MPLVHAIQISVAPSIAAALAPLRASRRQSELISVYALELDQEHVALYALWNDRNLAARGDKPAYLYVRPSAALVAHAATLNVPVGALLLAGAWRAADFERQEDAARVADLAPTRADADFSLAERAWVADHGGSVYLRGLVQAAMARGSEEITELTNDLRG